jgi:TonB family protein
VTVLVLAAALALGSPPVSIPGTNLKLGQSLGAIDSVLGLHGAPADARGHAQRQSRVRFFGLEGDASLDFADAVLETASFDVATPSSHTLDYIADQMRRSGYRGGCIEKQSLSCEWSGAASVTLTANDQHLTARVRRPEPDANATPVPAAPAPVATETPLLTDTLDAVLPGGTAPAGLRTVPVKRLDVEMRYPPAAHSAGVQGVVRVLVLVDTDGAVSGARVLKSIPELDAAALEVAHGAHFEPVVVDGKPSRFYARLVIPFTVH